MTYRGPREFPSFTAAQQEALSRLARSVAELDDVVSGGVLFRIAEGAEFGDFQAGFGRAHMVNTESGGTVNVALPSADSRQGGKCCAIVRLHATGTINWLPGKTTIDGSSAAAVPSGAGLYVAFFDGVRWSTWRS